MAAKPTTLPRWATNPGADVVEPTSAKKDDGFVSDEEPPAQYFNWLFETIYDWVNYLNDGALSGNHTFANDVTITGNLDITPDADLLHGDREEWSPPIGFEGSNASWNVLGYVVTTGLSTVDCYFKAAVGQRIKSAKYRYYGNGADNISVKLWKSTGATKTQIGSTTTHTAPSASWADGTITVATPETVATGTMYWISFELGGSSMRVGPYAPVMDRV